MVDICTIYMLTNAVSQWLLIDIVEQRFHAHVSIYLIPWIVIVCNIADVLTANVYNVNATGLASPDWPSYQDMHCLPMRCF